MVTLVMSCVNFRGAMSDVDCTLAALSVNGLRISRTQLQYIALDCRKFQRVTGTGKQYLILSTPRC